MARLSVNLNKLALLRNSRHTGVPDLLKFALIAIEAGAEGVTVHPRPDERHIRREDVSVLGEFMRPWRPSVELNVEGFPDQRLLQIVNDVQPEQCTLVPDEPAAFTSEKGWDFTSSRIKILQPALAELRRLRSRSILFIDPDPKIVEHVSRLGADGIEIYTGRYAAAFRAGNYIDLLNACVATAQEAQARGLVVNIGHDLNMDNLPPLVAQMPNLVEASIGHELTADALVMGFHKTIQSYVAALRKCAINRQ